MYDYMIIGAGSAGCVLAARLSEDPSIRVLLVEAGKPDRHPYIHMPAGFAKLTGAIANWGWSTIPQQHAGNAAVWYPQGKVLGGSSSINAQIYTRGHPFDYDNWEKMGCQGWGYGHVLPYFKRAEDNEIFIDAYHSAGGPLGVSDPISPLPISKTFLQAAQQAGIPYNRDFNGAKQEGMGFYQTTTRNARRCSAAVAYLKGALSRKNLVVWTQCLTTKLIVENGRVRGASVLRKGKMRPEDVFCEREVLLTSGAIGSPRLMLMSGIGPADELRAVGITPTHHLPGVGKNFHDHFDLYVVSECRGNYSYDKHNRLDKTLIAGLEYLLFKKGPVTSNLCEAGGFWFVEENSPAPDIQFHLVLGSGINYTKDKLRHCGITLNTGYMRPRARGSVMLASDDITAAPLIDPNFWGDPHDRAQSIAGFRLAREIMRQPAFAPFIEQERLPGAEVETDEDIIRHVSAFSKTDYHPVGSCKMGIDDMAVVDPASLKVHGLEGLRICDSSIMPQVISSNTNAATIMIGEKASDLIRGLPLLSATDPRLA